MERLDKFLVSQNIGSRKEAARLVRGGAVTVNGQTAKDPAQKLDPALDRVAVDGREVAYRKHLYIMLEQARGGALRHRGQARPTVLDLLPQNLQRRGCSPRAAWIRTPPGCCSSPTTGTSPTGCWPPKATCTSGTRR